MLLVSGDEWRTNADDGDPAEREHGRSKKRMYLYTICINTYILYIQTYMLYVNVKSFQWWETFLKNKMYIQILIELFTYLKNQPDFEKKLLLNILIESVFHLIKKYTYA